MTQFNPTTEQELAINYPYSAVITACPGSGKTAVIAQKVRNVLPTLRAHQGVIAISYTNKASDELRKRCELGAIDLKRSYFGTIDKFCISEILLPFLPHLFTISISTFSVKNYDSLSVERKLKVGAPPRHLTTADLRALWPAVMDLITAGIILLETVGVLSVYVLQNSEACQRYLKARYSHIFVDEYQDSGEPQHVLFSIIHQLGLISTAVGDINQSIFGFDKRDPKYLKSLCVPGSGYHPFQLTQNHRCHPSITNYANRLLDPTCQLIPCNEIKIFKCRVEGHQGDIAKWIDGHLDKLKDIYGVKENSEIGILTRNANTAEILKREMKTPSRLFSESTLSYSSHQSSSIFAAILTLRHNKSATVQSFLSSMVTVTSRIELANIRKLISRCRSVSAIDLKNCMVGAAMYITASPVPTDSINELDAVLNDPQQLREFYPIDSNEIQIMTLHKSKGLEFTFVYHLDLYDWIMPKRAYIAGNYEVVYEDEQQCLNLHYVGITRAQRGCALVYSTSRYNYNGDLKTGNPSQFFDRPGLREFFS
jgi:DNA helicase-2/ATP-dependent DNA helicase PcrA